MEVWWEFGGTPTQLFLLTTVVKLMGPGGSRAVIAESLLVKHQLVILNRGRERAPNLRPMDRVVAGKWGNKSFYWIWAPDDMKLKSSRFAVFRITRFCL